MRRRVVDGGVCKVIRAQPDDEVGGEGRGRKVGRATMGAMTRRTTGTSGTGLHSRCLYTVENISFWV